MLRYSNKHAMVHLEAKVKELNASYGKVTMEQAQKKANVKGFTF